MRNNCSPRFRPWADMCLFAMIVASVSCGRREGDSTSSRSGVAAPSVVVYCSADKEFAELIFHAYEATTGVKILPLYDTEETKTAGLTARLVAEKARPKADVFWSSTRAAPSRSSIRASAPTFRQVATTDYTIRRSIR